MSELLNGLYEVAFWMWNKLVEKGVEVIILPIHEAGDGNLWSTVSECYGKLAECTVPLATIFFMISIYRAVISEPPEQQLRRFMQDAIRFAIILYLSAHMLEILQLVAQFSSDITKAFAFDFDKSSLTDAKYENSELAAVINKYEFFPEFNIFSFGTFLKQFIDRIGELIILLLGGIISVFIMTASGIVVISVAFQRIIKPLVILPFSAIILGISSCSGEGERMMWQFGKAFLGFCISGAFMIIAIRLGNGLTTAYISPKVLGNDPKASSETMKAFVAIIQTDMAAIVITGLLKSMDGVVAKVFG